MKLCDRAPGRSCRWSGRRTGFDETRGGRRRPRRKKPLRPEIKKKKKKI